MKWLKETWHRICSIARRREVEHGLREEIQFHIEQQIEKNVRAGMASEEARRQALLRFGGVERTKASTRDEVRLALLEDGVSDLRHAFRSVRKQPGFAAVAVLTLAFGIGVNTSLFGLISAFLLQPLSVEDPYQLVLVMQRSDKVNVPIGHSFPDYLDYREQVPAFSDLVAYLPTSVHLSTRGATPERTWVEVVSPNYFALARVEPAAVGRLLRPGEGEGKGAAPVAVLSHAYWQRRFGEDPSVVGEPITLNGRAFTVIGVAPEGFTGLSWAMAPSAFVPSGALGVLRQGGDTLLEDRADAEWRLMGRLTPGTSLQVARAEVETVARRLAADYPAEHNGSRVLVIPETRARPDPTIADFIPIFATVFAAMAALVLLIACANVANLMLSRALVRQRELVIRCALGASRFRLIRLQLVEGLVLAAVAGALALVLAEVAGQVLSGFVLSTQDVPVNTSQPQDWRVFAFTGLASVLAGIATALWPARRATQFDLAKSLKEGGSHGGTSRHAFRSLLVVGQVTMSLIVLASAGLFVQSLRHLQHAPLGFRPDGLFMAAIDLDRQQYSERRGRGFLEELVRRAETLPSVTSATVTSHVPFGNDGWGITDVAIDGPIPGTKDDRLSSARTIVGPGYFDATGVTLVRGRTFERTDTATSRRVAVVNETMARTLWPERDAIGQRLRVYGDWVEVVGVARDGKYLMLYEDARPYLYLPLSQHYRSPMTVLVRSASDPAGLASPLRRLLREMDPDLPPYNVRTMENHIQGSVFGLMPIRVAASMAGVQGLIGLCLAVMGLYAVVSYAVARRTREIGIRMALGATPHNVRRLVIREGMRLSLLGMAFGLLVAFGVGLVLSRLLYGVAPLDVAVLVGVTALLVTVSALACYVPARRATRVDPLVTLRYE